jgi:hypothetical protein
MAAAWSAIRSYGPWIVGAGVAFFAWLLMGALLSRSRLRSATRKAPQKSIALTQESFAAYVRTSPVLLAIEVRLAAGLGLDLSTEVRNLALMEAQVRSLGISDMAGLDKLLSENEAEILTLASHIRWESLHRGDALQLLLRAETKPAQAQMRG